MGKVFLALDQKTGKEVAVKIVKDQKQWDRERVILQKLKHTKGVPELFFAGKEKELLRLLIMDYKGEFTPIEVSRKLSVTNKTIINRLAVLVKNGFVVPILVNQRIRSYELSKFTRDNEEEIMKAIL